MTRGIGHVRRALARGLIILIALLLTGYATTAATAQGFAGLGSAAEGFAEPRPGVVPQFPADHGPHAGFRIEWWYLTANLTGADGREYGAQWTLFRSALAPGEAEGWASPQVWMGHAAVTAPDRQFVAERFARGGIGQAGVTAEPFVAWIDDWSLGGSLDGTLRATARGPDFAFALEMTATGPLVLHGDRGFSVKAASGQASYYYSQPFLTVTGRLDLPGGPVEVTGTAWLDREWSSQPLSEDQAGWDWFSLHLDGGDKVMGFRLRGRKGADFTAATWIAADGTPTPLGDGALTAEPLSTSPVAGRQIPTRWRVRLPARGLDVEVEALFAGAWMDTSFAYWEGPVRISGSHTGRGYLEMTGY